MAANVCNLVNFDILVNAGRNNVERKISGI